MSVSVPAFIRASIAAALVAFLLRTLLRDVLPRNTLPPHLLGHPVVVERELISAEAGERLRDLVKAIGARDGYPTVTAETSFHRVQHEHIGEARPLVNGRCPHPYMIPSNDGTFCSLASRIDVGRHLVLTGGARGLREPPEKIISRVQSFGVYNFNLTKFEVVGELFRDSKFQRAAKAVCPPKKQHLDPFQFNFIIQLPGQTVSTHIDGTYFWGASRFQFPQWLLSAMKFSGMYEDKFVDQVQVVGYLHRWEPEPTGGGEGGDSLESDDDGSFVYWDSPSTAPKVVAPFPLSGSVIDGSKTAHGASVYRMSADLPFIDKSIGHWLRLSKEEVGEEGEDLWTVSNEQDGVLKNYTFDDLRISIVYRGRCFADSGEAKRFRAQLHDKDGERGGMELDDVLSRFVDDLTATGHLPRGSTLAGLDRLALALKIMDKYIQYPLPSIPLIPWNYCALPLVAPWLARLVGLVC